MEEHVRPLAFKTKPPMIAITVQNGLSIPASLKVGAFRVRPAQALNCQDGGEGDEEAVQEELDDVSMKALLDASFINSFKQGNEEGQSKYALMGQLLEDPTLESFWKYNEQEEEEFGV